MNLQANFWMILQHKCNKLVAVASLLRGETSTHFAEDLRFFALDHFVTNVCRPLRSSSLHGALLQYHVEQAPNQLHLQVLEAHQLQKQSHVCKRVPQALTFGPFQE